MSALTYTVGLRHPLHQEISMRRVVMGNDSQGKAVVAGDGEPEAIRAADGAALVQLIWGWDGTPSVPNDGTKPSYRRYFPPQDGLRVIVLSMPPDDDPIELDPDLREREFVGLFADADWDP
jgi:hypothetical protein